MVIDITVVMQRRRDPVSDDEWDALVDKIHESSEAAGLGDPFFAFSVGEPHVIWTIEAETLADAVVRVADFVQKTDLGLGELQFIGLDKVGLEDLCSARVLSNQES